MSDSKWSSQMQINLQPVHQQLMDPKQLTVYLVSATQCMSYEICQINLKVVLVLCLCFSSTKLTFCVTYLFRYEHTMPRGSSTGWCTIEPHEITTYSSSKVTNSNYTIVKTYRTQPPVYQYCPNKVAHFVLHNKSTPRRDHQGFLVPRTKRARAVSCYCTNSVGMIDLISGSHTT